MMTDAQGKEMAIAIEKLRQGFTLIEHPQVAPRDMFELVRNGDTVKVSTGVGEVLRAHPRIALDSWGNTGFGTPITVRRWRLVAARNLSDV